MVELLIKNMCPPEGIIQYKMKITQVCCYNEIKQHSITMDTENHMQELEHAAVSYKNTVLEKRK